MYTIDELVSISSLALIGAGILTWCCKMQWDQRALGKLINKWKTSADENAVKHLDLEAKIVVMEAKYDFMCNLVMDDVKQRRKDLWEHHSPLKPTETARGMIPEDILNVLKEFTGNGSGSQCMLKSLYIVERISVDRLSEAARQVNLSMLEFMALITDIEV